MNGIGPPPFHPNCRCKIVMLTPPAGLDYEEVAREVKRIRRAIARGLNPVLSPGWMASAPLVSGTIIEIRKAFESVAITKDEEASR